MTTATTNNIIIGGGLAGLYCAWQLQQRGEDFMLLEASSRFGGRIMVANATTPFDLGATWFWPHQTNMLTLTQALSLNTFEQYIEGDTLFQSADCDCQRMHYQQAQSYRIANGSMGLVSALVNKLAPGSLKLNSPVKVISKTADNWCIQFENNRNPIETQRLFIAIPPRQIVKHLNVENWLTPGTIDYLSMQQTWMSAQAKYVAMFETPFWREERLSGFTISHKGPMVEIHDASFKESGAFFGFIGVPAQHRQHYSEQDLTALCRQQLVDIYGSKANPISDYIQDWSKEQYIASERDTNESPRHSQISTDRLYQNDDLNNVFFIASEFSATEPGYMEGALDAVERALDSAFNSEANKQHT